MMMRMSFNTKFFKLTENGKEGREKELEGGREGGEGEEGSGRSGEEEQG